MPVGCVFLQGKTEAITAVKLLSCFDDLVAAGTAAGRVAIFQLVSSLPGRNRQVRARLRGVCTWTSASWA